MALASNSSIRAWLEFNGTLPLTMQPCHQYSYPNDYQLNESFAPVPTIANCTQVCNDSTSLFTSPSNNLVVCGLWTQVIAYETYIGPGNSILPPNNYSNPFDVFAMQDEVIEGIDPTLFEPIGLNLNNADTPSYADIISGCLMDIYITVNVNASNVKDTVPSACTKNKLFPLLTNESWTSPQFSSLLEDELQHVPYSIRDCIDAICSPRTVNSDVAGIGVFLSYIMQSSIAVIASLSLFGHELWIASGRTTKSKFKGALVAALVDFHKSQCYFLGTVQTVALTFMFSEIDSSILGLLATGGFIPIVYTLACIGRYGRKSGYCILLSAITFSLASTPLIMSWVRGGAETTPPGEASVYSTFCGVPHTLRELLYPICGSSSLDDNFIGQDTILHSPLVWIVWAYCGLWLFIYIFGVGFQALFQALFPRQYSCIERLLRYPPAYSWTILFGGTWALCFCFQFYLFSVYFKHSLISMEWTLGQIIAITIWTPSIVEYIYILIYGIEAASRYRYPSPFKVMKGVAYESVNLAMVNVPRQNQGGKSNSEPRNDDTFLLDRSSRRSRSRRTSTRAHRDIDE